MRGATPKMRAVTPDHLVAVARLSSVVHVGELEPDDVHRQPDRRIEPGEVRQMADDFGRRTGRRRRPARPAGPRPPGDAPKRAPSAAWRVIDTLPPLEGALARGASSLALTLASAAGAGRSAALISSIERLVSASASGADRGRTAAGLGLEGGVERARPLVEQQVVAARAAALVRRRGGRQPGLAALGALHLAPGGAERVGRHLVARAAMRAGDDDGRWTAAISCAEPSRGAVKFPQTLPVCLGALARRGSGPRCYDAARLIRSGWPGDRVLQCRSALRTGAGNPPRPDFRIDPGSFHFLTGPSGSGKTSLLRCCCCR